MLIPLRHPFTMLVSGPSGCGKTTFVCRLLANLSSAVDIPVKKVFWCFAEENAKPNLPSDLGLDITFHVGIPENFPNELNEPMLIILDDLMGETGSSVRVSELFTRGSHHRNLSIILLTQNIFHKGPHTRDISLNAKYIVLFKNPRDPAQFNFLARQIYPENSSELMRIYKQATLAPHSYLLIDLTQTVNDLLRFRTDIFNSDGCVCYCNKKNLTNNNASETFEGHQTYFVHPTNCGQKSS